MQLSEVFKQRRSIRKYADKKVPVSLIHDILEEAKLAPSAGNTQNWRFLLVTDPNKKKQIANLSLKQTWMTSAPVHIVVCNDSDRLVELYGKNGKFFSIQNCAAITSFILLSAVDKGLSGCWVGIFDYKEMQKVLELPENIYPDAIITLGYSEELKNTPRMRNEVENMTYFNKWGNKKHVEDKPKLKDRIKKTIKK